MSTDFQKSIFRQSVSFIFGYEISCVVFSCERSTFTNSKRNHAQWFIPIIIIRCTLSVVVFFYRSRGIFHWNNIFTLPFVWPEWKYKMICTNAGIRLYPNCFITILIAINNSSRIWNCSDKIWKQNAQQSDDDPWVGDAK